MENSRNSNQWYVCFLNNLNKKNIWLKENIEKWQNCIVKWKNWEKLTNKERNIYSWYKFNNYSYSSPDYNLKADRRKILEEFKSDPYYIFKNMVEIMWRDLVSKHLRKILQEKLEHGSSRLQVFITSDSDDVFWWVDLIAKISEKWKNEYLWIDIAVSAREDYLVEKSKKKTETICMEFNKKEKIKATRKIERNVLQFSPKIMAELLWEYLEGVESGEYIDALEKYSEIKTKNIQQVKDDTNFKVNNLLRI